MIGIIYTDKEKMLIDLQSTSQLNKFTAKKQGKEKHIERYVNAISYTYYIEHPNGLQWAIICDNEGKVAKLLSDGVELSNDWFPKMM